MVKYILLNKYKEIKVKRLIFFNVNDHLQSAYGYERMPEVLLHTFI